MTYAPPELLDLRHYLQPITGLPDSALGIVGDEDHHGGYHHGWDDRAGDGDYSWDESTRDWNHKTNAASGFDIGMFARLRELSNWLVAECAAGAADTLDIREVIYSPDGKTVKRWDRLGIRSTGDSSHLTHTHISYFRDAEARDKTGPFRRFFEGEGMAYDRDNAWRWQGYLHGDETIEIPETDAAGSAVKFTHENKPQQQWDRIEKAVAAIAVPAPAPVDPAALKAVLLDPEVLTAIAAAVADEDHRRSAD